MSLFWNQKTGDFDNDSEMRWIVNYQALKELRIACYTLGCKVNGYESQAITELFEKHGFILVDFDQPADVYLINTCTVTQIAARKSRQIIHRAKKLNPEALIVACGCYVDQEKDHGTFEGIADMAISNKDKERLVAMVIKCLKEKMLANDQSEVSDIEEELFITSTGNKTRAFLKVQDGCRQFCSYCIIPYVRGPLKSKPIEKAVAEAKALAANGCLEIVLTGIHLSSYGREMEQDVDLADLILRIQEIEGIQRIRLGSLEVGLITDAFIEKIKYADKLCPHYHLSLQSGCAVTLKEMNRKYTPEQYEAAVTRLRNAFPDVAVTTDVIVGFPGESDANDQESYEFIKRIGFAGVHVFQYSPREGTVAARRKDSVQTAVKKLRSEKMIHMTEENAKCFYTKYINTSVNVLLEDYNEKGKCWEGYTANYCKVHVSDPDKKLSENTMHPVMIQAAEIEKGEIFLMGLCNE